MAESLRFPDSAPTLRRASEASASGSVPALVVALLATLAGCSPRAAELERENARLRDELARLQSAARVASDAQGDSGGDSKAAEPSSGDGAERAARDPELLQQVDELRALLAREQELRLEREREWLRYTTAFSALGGSSIPESIHFEAQAPAEELPAPPPPPVVDEARVRRAAELARSVRTLLSVEGVRGIDLLEVGELHDGYLGPVVFRLLDGRGRLAGSLSAQRLRLTGSRAARTLTLVLEDGFEARGGVRVSFDPESDSAGEREPFGVRRIHLEDVDPMPWVSAAPELFGGLELEAPADDGQWNLTWVRATLNGLLRVDVEHGYWRVKTLGGVADGVLHEVHLEQFNADGKLDRRLFADRLRIERKERGVGLVLESGATLRGDEKIPFLDGRFRIFLPRASHEEWNAAGLPGLTSTPKGAARSGGALEARD